MGTISQDVAAGAPPPKSLAARIAGVFFSPAETFDDIARQPSFWAPLVLAVLAFIAVSETLVASLGAERIIRLSLEQRGQAARMTPEQMEQAISRGALFVHVQTFVGPVIVVIALLVIAGLGMLITNLLYGAQLKFKTVFSITAYANLIGVLGALISIPLIIFGDHDQLNVQNFTPTNLGFFLSWRDTSKAMYSLASSLDLFTFWFMIVLSIGLSRATGGKVKTGSIFAVYCGLWALWVLAKMGLAVLLG
jgi:hypothetical protein